jgi:pimeloyl-ACP methyl ester carboxylesterase
MATTSHAVSLHFQQSGNGAPIVILHGLFGSSRNWQTTARQFAEDFNVVTVDLRNHGASPHAPHMNYTALAADVLALLEKLDLQDVALMGHSMGGKAAMTLALSDPGRIARLIVVDIAPGAYVNEYEDMINAMENLDLNAITRRVDADSRLAEAIPDNEIRLFILQNLRFRTDAPPVWRINLQAIHNEIANLVGAIPCNDTAHFNRPTYFIRGANSNRVLERDLPTIERYFPNYEMLTIAHAGHWPHAENPTEFQAKLRHILLDGPRRSGP